MEYKHKGYPIFIDNGSYSIMWDADKPWKITTGYASSDRLALDAAIKIIDIEMEVNMKLFGE